MSLYGCDAGNILRECSDCPVDEKNKIVHVAFVDKTAWANISTTNPTTDIKAAEAACTAYVIRNVSGGYDGGTYSEGKAPGKQVTKIQGGTHIVTFTDFGYIENVDFWNRFKNVSNNYRMVYFTDTFAWFVPYPLTVMPKPVVSDDSTTNIEAEITVRWSSKDNPVNYAASVDAMESCAELFVYASLDWTQTSGSQATILDSTFTVGSGDGIYITLDTAKTLDKIEVVEGDLPTGISAEVSSDLIIIDGSSVVTGTHEVTLKAFNACGVATEFTVTFIIE